MKLKRARGENWAILVEEDTPGDIYEETRKYEIWLLSGALGYAGRIDCTADVSGGTVRSDVADF